MKLFYYKDDVGNFGDDLNPWLWERLLPDFLDDDEQDWLIGIGTLLNHKLPVAGRKHVFGSGFGYGSKPALDDSYNFLCVRGPMTARMLDLPETLALTDGAILIRTVTTPSADKSFRYGFMPHHISQRNFDWEKLCRDLGFNFIDPAWSVDRVLGEMAKCEAMICEAMHGAIVSDALRIPWIPVACYDYISAFKWEDWLLTAGLPYSPVRITSLYDPDARLSFLARRKREVRLQLQKLGLLGKAETQQAPTPASSQALVDRAREELKLAASSRQYLSADAICEELTERCCEKLRELEKLKPH